MVLDTFFSVNLILVSAILASVHTNNTPASSQKQRGIPGASSRIVGGTTVDISSCPYQLSLLNQNRHICGAAILTDKFVVTAAHCTHTLRFNPSAITLRAGSAKLNQGGQLVNVKSVHQHPWFKLAEVDYDISILEVTPRFSFSETVRGIGLVGGEPPEGSLVTISGWGTVEENADRLPSQLRSTQIPIVSRRKCRQAYAKVGEVTNRMICAGSLEQGGKDSCQGDSGGPLTFKGRLAGIVSWGYGCGQPKYPGVYTNIANSDIRKFVKRITGI